MKIVNIVFDIGMVLAEFPWRNYLHNFGFSKEVEERLAKAVFLSDNWKEQDRGTLSDEQIYQNCLLEVPDLKEELNQVWQDRITIVKEYPYAADWLRKLKEKGYRIYLLSNYGRATFAEADRTFEFLKYADGRVISYEIQAIKPERKMYEELVIRYGIVPSETVFLDDLPENIKAGEEFGFYGIVFANLNQAKEELEKLGVSER